MATAKSPRKFGASAIVFGLMVAGAGAIAWYGMGLSGGGSPATNAQAATIAPAPELQAPAPTGARAAAGGLPTRIRIPSAGIDAAIVEVGVVMKDGAPEWEVAWRAAGHHIDSARPGQPGNMVITGHVSVADSSNLAVFRTLNLSKVGDIVEVDSGDNVYRYAITKVFVADASATDILRSDYRATVTLITCTPDLKRRLVVVGTLIPPGS
ncbi:MAG: sortase [Chloroflexi bacterium]|nr:sortase [Chloroflexota bacterium]